MLKLLRFIRPIILVFSCFLALFFYARVQSLLLGPDQQHIVLGDDYGLTAVFFLYLSLLPTPLYGAVPRLPGRALYIKARRALGVSAFFFALLHTAITFFYLLDGFAGLKFLNSEFLLAISLSFIALVILFILTITSLDATVRVLGKYWKRLHRLVYAAAVLILIHALLLGSSFVRLSSLTARIFLVAAALLLMLEIIRVDKFVSTRLSPALRYLLLLCMMLGLSAFCYYFLIAPLAHLHAGHHF